MQTLEFIFDAEEPERLDKYLAGKLQDLSRNAAAGLIEKERVTVNGMRVPKKYLLPQGAHIIVQLPDPEPISLIPENIPLEILYEDSDLIVVNKPKGMVVHPAPGNATGTLVHALLFHCGDSLSGINGKLRPGIVHRIDRMTSGLLMVAKNDKAHNALAAQIKAHSFLREYEAVVCGVLKNRQGTVDAPIGRHPVKRKCMAVTEKNAKPAVTHYSLIHAFRKHSHVRLKLETGRTHQIRVHMAYIGHPVLGDEVYSSARPFTGLTGQCLHAKKIGFLHPSTGVYLEFDSMLPDYFLNVLNRL